jgi:ABC-type transport system involved in multi-copper enzyme maturation permease subunit
MRELLKTDFRRALKDKLLIVLLISGGAFALFTPLLYKGILLTLDAISGAETADRALSLGFDAKSQFFILFSPANNFGMILPIFVVIILCRDFSNGTIRNKIICGKSRSSIFLSMFITCSALVCALILIHALLTLFISLILFKYQAEPFTFADFGYLMASIGFEMIFYIFISALLSFFVVFMKNAVLSIVMYFVVNIAMTIIGSITQLVSPFIGQDRPFLHELLEFLNVSNVFTSLSIGSATYDLKTVLYLLLPNLVLSGLLIFLGLVVFKKKDLK